MKTRIVIAASLLAMGAYAQKPADLPAGAAGGMSQVGEAHGNGGGGNKGSNPNLIDHGGPVLPASHIYYFWWGNQSSWPSDAVTGLSALANGFAASSTTVNTFMKDIFPQYMRGSSLSASFAGSYYDSSAPPASNPAVSTMINEACKVIGANGLSTDSSAVYVILTSNFPNGANYCAWHSWGSCNGKTIQVAYVPNTTNVTGCNISWGSGITYSAGTNSIGNVLSHEFSETITDPDGTAWFDSKGSEIGDKCAWQFNGYVTNLPGAGTWQLQMEWNNATSACIQQ